MIHREDIIHAARPLRWIFWGALLVLVDISFSMTFGETGFQFDLLNDTLGMLLITAAVGRLRNIGLDSSYANRMQFIHWVAIVALLESLMNHFVFQKSWLLMSLSLALDLATIVALLAFCTSMRDVCRAGMLAEAGQKWHRTFVLFLVLYGIPGLLLVFFGIAAIATNQSFRFDLTPSALVIGLLFLVPLFYFFSATSTMARAAEAMPESTPELAPEPAPLPHATALRGY